MPTPDYLLKKYGEMKNRLQFNRLPKLYASREEATAALELHYKDSSFIPLIGEPLVVRYYDENGEKQAILAIGKATGKTADDKFNRKYHIIDTAEINENVAGASFSAGTALGLASAATQSVNNYFQILKNMIGDSGISLDNGSYFDDDDPTKDPSTCGLYDKDKVDSTTYIKDATSLVDADRKLDAAIGDVSDGLDGLSGATINLSANTVAADQVLDSKINELSANTIAADDALNDKIDQLSAGTIATDQELADRIAELEGNKILGEDAIVAVKDGNGDTTISLKLYEDEKVLSQTNRGLRSDIALDYEPAERKIYLRGKDGIELGHINTDDFVKDGMITMVTVFTPTQEWIDSHSQYAYAQLEAGQPYLWITFNVDSDKNPKDVFIRLDSLVDVYTVDPDSHTYMHISDDYVISLTVDQENGLASYNYVESISAITTHILSGTGLNMLDPGEYPGHEGTQYINDANNLDQADVLLDKAIQNLSGVVGDVNNRIDILSSVTREFSANTFYTFKELSGIVKDLSAVTESFAELSGVVINLSSITESFSANTVEALSAINVNLEILSATVIDDELVTAAALNDLNRRINELSGGTGEGLEALSASVVNNVTNISVISGDVAVLSGVVIDNEEVTAAALNDLNNRIIDNDEDIADLYDKLENVSAKTSGVLTLSLNGVEQGKYSPSANTAIDLQVIQEVTGEDVHLTNYVISSGSTEQELEIKPTDNVNQAFGKLEKKVNDNEKVTSAALNDLNDRVIELSGITGDYYNELNQKINNLSVSGASEQDLLALSGAVINLSSSTVSIKNEVDECFDDAEYDSTNKRINFKHGNTVKASIDATAFIKDGMVENVTISGGNLVITFNTDAGKQPISIPLTDIFNPNNYYTKTEINSISGGIVTNLNALSAGTIAVDNRVTNLSAGTVAIKADLTALSASVVTNKTNITALSAGTVQGLTYLSGVIEENELVISSALNDLNDRIIELSGNTPDMSNYYTKSEVNNYVSGATQRKYTTASTLTNLAFNEFLTIVKINGSTTLSIASTGLPVLPANGVAERHLIIENTGSTDAVVTITTDSRIKLTMNNLIAIDRSGGIGELNALITYDGSAYTIYVITT